MSRLLLTCAVDALRSWCWPRLLARWTGGIGILFLFGQWSMAAACRRPRRRLLTRPHLVHWTTVADRTLNHHHGQDSTSMIAHQPSNTIPHPPFTALSPTLLTSSSLSPLPPLPPSFAAIYPTPPMQLPIHSSPPSHARPDGCRSTMRHVSPFPCP